MIYEWNLSNFLVHIWCRETPVGVSRLFSVGKGRVVPGHYTPIPKAGWELVGKTKLFEECRSFECVAHWIIGLLPIPISYECLGEPPTRGEGFVYSWEACPCPVGTTPGKGR